MLFFRNRLILCYKNQKKKEIKKIIYLTTIVVRLEMINFKFHCSLRLCLRHWWFQFAILLTVFWTLASEQFLNSVKSKISIVSIRNYNLFSFICPLPILHTNTSLMKTIQSKLVWWEEIRRLKFVENLCVDGVVRWFQMMLFSIHMYLFVVFSPLSQRAHNDSINAHWLCIY